MRILLSIFFLFLISSCATKPEIEYRTVYKYEEVEIPLPVFCVPKKVEKPKIFPIDTITEEMKTIEKAKRLAESLELYKIYSIDLEIVLNECSKEQEIKKEEHDKKE